MSTNESIDELIRDVQTMDRDGCMTQLRQIGRPRIDFTDEFLNSLSLDRLRHVVVAAFLQSRKRPAR
jgi:hypothetical protein